MKEVFFLTDLDDGSEECIDCIEYDTDLLDGPELQRTIEDHCRFLEKVHSVEKVRGICLAETSNGQTLH